MTIENDYILQRYGLTAANSQGVNKTVRANLYPPSVVLDKTLDETWAGSYNTSAAGNPYYDYFYTGEDIIVCIDGTEDDPNFRVLPLLAIGYNVVQQKAPVFAFWDYTYSAVLRGTRLVQGQFILATKSPNYLKQALAKAAQSRQDRLGSVNYNYNKGLTEDDANIEKYWGKNIDPALNAIGTSLYSVHPPFSFVIIYGVQNVSLTELNRGSDLYQKYINDSPWLSDTNERLIESDTVNQSNRSIIDACEIQSMTQNVDTDGSIISETYTFFARDYINP